MEGFWKFTFFLIPTLLCLLASVQSETLNGAKVQWVPSNEVDWSVLEPAGLERNLTRPLFVIRGLHNSSMIPGKYSEHSDMKAYIAYDGKEFTPTYYEFLFAPPGSLSWVEASNKTVPIERAIYGGTNPETLENLYICRGLYNRWVIPGSYSYEKVVCSFPYESSEHKRDHFEILVLNWYGELIDAGTGQPAITNESKE